MNPASHRGDAQPGVYVELSELAVLEHKASGFSFLPRQPVHSLLSGRHASRIRGRGLDFEEIRTYLPGDDPRTIDWKITQRTGEPHVRVYTEERDRPAILVVDQRLNMFFGTRRAMKSHVAAELAALAAWRVFSGGDRVGALVFNDERVEQVRPHRSRRRVVEILSRVVELNRELRVDSAVASDPGMLNSVLTKVERLARHDHLVCVISDFHGADEETRRRLTRLAAHNDVLAALLYDPSKTDLPDQRRLVVTDGRLQLELGGPVSTRREIGEYFAADLKRTRDDLERVGIPVLPIDTVEDPAAQVRRILGQR